MQAPGFRYSFTPLPGYFSPFPHGTHPLSVIRKYSGNRVVSADSHRIPRAPCYSGTPSRRPTGSAYGAITHYGPPSQGIRLPHRLDHCAPPRQQRENNAPQPHDRNPCRVSHDHGLTIIRFRSPLLTEYPLLRVLRCFTSPRHPPRPMNSSAGDRA